MAQLIFPDHAIRRMRERGISEDEVYLTVEDADDELEREDGRELMVVDDDGEARTVVSLWDGKRRRPRRR